jgi:membrane protein implicated in regulation of membrane protease activity
MIYIWLFIGLFFAFLEMGSPGLLFFLSFSGGAFLTALTATVLTVNSINVNSLWMETIGLPLIFVTYSILFLLVCKRIVQTKHLNAKGEHTNIFALCGAHAIVIKTLSRDTAGYVVINGEQWRAFTDNDDVITQKEKVVVIKVRGAHVVVRRITQ